MVAKGNRAIWLLTILLICLSAAPIAAAPSNETYFRLTISSRAEISTLTRIVSIDNVVSDTVYAYANPAQLASLASAGYTYTVLPAPSSLATPQMSQERQAYAWDSYPTYDQYVTMMQQYAQSYPSLCHLDTIGTTTQGRLLLVATISNNVSTEANKPEVLLTSSIHGDELVGYILMLRLIDTLLTGYGGDQGVTHLLDSVKIYVNPLANPDGTYHGGNNTVSGARRGNANGIDLNRNYPDPQDGPHPDGNAWQAETVASMNFANTHWPVLAVNFHGGAQVVNYPWDTWATRHPDDAWFQMVSRQYADTCHIYAPSGYMADLSDGITDGYDWYEVNGGRQDYMNYFHG
ncbi:MAG TPA: M14 family zinc carboxypeptidase, partial [Candidatus Acidoferrum sp.]|nr:M14 family zinc carboxypeptidase [Candidatus Acidoferrum sp.]